MAVVTDVLWLTFVAALWGGTNPLIKKAGKGVEKVKSASAVGQFFAEIKFLILNWRYVAAVLLNQSGSVVFYLTLSSADISLAVPLTNSLTFMFTAISSRLLGEKIKKETYIGVLLVAVGVALCIWSKLTENRESKQEVKQ